MVWLVSSRPTTVNIVSERAGARPRGMHLILILESPSRSHLDLASLGTEETQS